MSEKEIVALVISNEEEDGRIYADFADGLRADYPASAKMFSEMAQEEGDHRRQLFDLDRERFGEHIPLVRRQDVRGFVQHRPVWQVRRLGMDVVRKQAQLMEPEAQRRMFVLRVIQPGLAGLMDGSVSTLAPVFAAAFATGRSWDAFLVGLAATIGAGISMGFAEALSDNGSLTGRGAPWIRGGICGLMTTLGGIGHTLPFLIQNFWTAMVVAVAVVIVELAIITWIRWKYMDTPPFSAALQVGFGGALVFATGILIGQG